MPSALLNLQPPPPAVTRSSTRIDALDWTKGALIICMVIYHAINYSTFRPLAFRFLAFLPPSFIFITGFLVGQVYAAKYDLGTWKPYARLAIRGTKLLLLFTFLNFARCVILEHSLLGGVDNFSTRLNSIYLSGNGRAGIFEVLLPIAYFLLLAPALLWFRSRIRGSTVICATAVFLLCQVLESNGKPLKNLDLLSVGVIGMAFGLVRIQTIDSLATKWSLVLFFYMLYRLCSYFVGETYPVQTFAAIVSVLLLYCCALHLNIANWLGRQMMVLGQYSLLGYLVQIAFLQGTVKALGGTPNHVIGVLAVISVTTILTFLIIKTIHESRQRSRAVQVIYKSVFA